MAIRKQATNKPPRPAPTIVGGTITRLAPQRDPARLSLYIDGQFVIGLGVQIVEDRALRVGQVLSASEVAELHARDEVGKAVDKALAYLTVRPRSIREVRERLQEKEVPPATIDAVLERLRDWGYVGDEGFARYWIENRSAHQPRGKQLLRQELWRKGVERETVEQALAAADLQEGTAALQLARKRQRQLHAYDEQTQRRRLAGYLQRRGYDWPTVKHALDQLFQPTDDTDSGEPLGDSDSYDFQG